MENKQTAVEWLEEQLSYDGGLGVRHPSYNEMADLNDYFDQAKEMDKEQKRNMFNCGRQYQLTGEGTFKEVYEEIYGDK
jgi:hypothetical protein